MINRQYKIIKKIGEGRSKVFLCKDTDLDEKEVAIKILPLDSHVEEREYFKNEYLTIRKINHPNIIKSFDYGIAFEINNPAFSIYEGSTFFVLEYFEGVELLEFPEIKDENILKEVIKQICEALFYLHQSDYIHYDLKPENILVTRINNNIKIKLIDLGFTAKRSVKQGDIKGTAEFIAPELLGGGEHDHTIDLYSLGIIIYRIIYDRFPFNTLSQLEIYKAQLEEEFSFPPNEYSPNLIEVLKKLLSKNPKDRYQSSLKIISDLGYKIDKDITSNFLPVKCFAARKDIISILRKYAQDKNSTEVFNIMGTEGAGKTSLFHEASEIIKNSVLVDNLNRNTGLSFIRRLLKKIFYAEFIFPGLNEHEKNKFYSIIDDTSNDIRADIKSYFISLSFRNEFTVFLDDFDSYDDFSLGIMNEIIPILQSNNIKIVISESSDKKSSAVSLFNRREIYLSSFMENELTDLMEMCYNNLFPKAELKKLILLYADLLPGNIELFIKDLLFFGILRYTEDAVTIEYTEQSEKLLKSSHEDIYQVRVGQLTEDELLASEFISCFSYTPDVKIVSALLNNDITSTRRIVESLEKKNILMSDAKSTSLLFSSAGMKDYLYSLINDKRLVHLFIADILKEKFPLFSNVEIARQYELGNEYEESYSYLRKEIELARNKLSFYYVKSLLLHIIKFPLSNSRLLELKLELAQIHYTLSDYKSALEVISQLDEFPEGSGYDALLIKGGSLIGIGEQEKGASILRDLLPIAPEEKKPGLLLIIASAELDLDNFSAAETICNNILNNTLASIDEVGKSLNLLGLIKIYTQNDFENALQYFSKAENVYSKGKHLFGVAQMQNNIANIHNMRGNFDKAESYWNKSLKINLEIGNLEQEATLLLNFGVLNFEKQDYEKSIYYYKRALSIYSSLGNKLRENIVQVNLGEIHLVLCEYQVALSYLVNAADNLSVLKNANEEAEALYLLAKFYLIIGDRSNYEIIYEKYKLLQKDQNLLEKNQIYLRYLNTIANIKLKKEVDIRDLSIIKNYFLEQKEKLKFLECTFYIVSILIERKIYNEAYIELMSQSLIDNCHNMSAEAERNFFLSIIAVEASQLKLEPGIDYLQRAYDLVNDSNITEFTWKILFALASHYFERGNLSKAQEFSTYCNSLLNFLAENIEDEKLRAIYLNEPERKYALEKLNSFEAHL